ncbi:MAG: recombination protein NinB [Patescibacteria group bacterium]|nr:recombination protein NinB [Patescibacteria group bacterium]
MPVRIQRRRAKGWKMPGINGGFVLLGMHTSGLSREDFSDLIDLAFAFCAEHSVVIPDLSSEAARDGEAVNVSPVAA